MEKVTLSHSTKKVNTQVPLPSSKSESNRALVMQALSRGVIQLENLSSARDTRTMARLLKSSDAILDVIDAGTTMRFLTAYCSVTGKDVVLTGTPRMCQRPIKLLVDALRHLGGNFEYQKEEGYPPLRTKGFFQKLNLVKIRGDVSSQYISALLMVAPTLPRGLNLVLTGHVGSMPYIKMTLRMMKKFGIRYHWTDQTITVPNQTYGRGYYTIESDWSGASYWYSIAALSQDCNIFLKGLREESLQGDREIVEIMDTLGVQSSFTKEGVQLAKIMPKESFEWDFTHCPDLAQTVSVICAAKGIPARLTGLRSLRIKETDRIDAIKNELEKFGIQVKIEGDEAIEIPRGTLKVDGQTVETYDDHRMAMAFAPLALLGNLSIYEPGVVAKSYPEFWDHLKDAGFSQSPAPEQVIAN